MARSLLDAAGLADERMRAALSIEPGVDVQERRDGWELVAAFSGLPITGAEALAYAAWVAPHSAQIVREGATLEEVILAVVDRTILVTLLALDGS